jgi:NitT/TauT family transport system substrate-binding protein
MFQVRVRPRAERRSRRRHLAAGVTVAAALAASSVASASTAPPDSAATGDSAAAGSDWVSPFAGVDLSPQPLAETGHLTIVVAAKLEFAAPLILADAFGEFEKENLDVTVEVTQTSMAAIAAGDVDGSWGAPGADMVNAVNSGLDIKWIAGNYVPSPGSLSGLWMRKDVVGDPPDINALAGTTTTNSQVGGVVTYFIDQLLQGSDVTIDQLAFEKLAPADTLAALVNGALDGAWLIDPLYRQVEDDPNMVFVGGAPLGEVGGGLLAGPTLLDPANAEATQALLRAMARTIDTYLQPGYKDDPDVVAALVEQSGLDEETIQSSGELLFTFAIAPDLITRMETTWDTLGLLESDGPLPEDQLVDRTFIDPLLSADG